MNQCYRHEIKHKTDFIRLEKKSKIGNLTRLRNRRRTTFSKYAASRILNWE